MTALQLRKERPEDRGISEEARRAIANYTGPVTVCPPCTFAIDFAEVDIARRNQGKNGWLQAKEASHRARQRRMKFERASTKAKAEAKPKASKMHVAADADRDARVLAFLSEWRSGDEVASFLSISKTSAKTIIYRMRDAGKLERKQQYRGATAYFRAIQEGAAE